MQIRQFFYAHLYEWDFTIVACKLPIFKKPKWFSALKKTSKFLDSFNIPSIFLSIFLSTSSAVSKCMYSIIYSIKTCTQLLWGGNLSRSKIKDLEKLFDFIKVGRIAIFGEMFKILLMWTEFSKFSRSFGVLVVAFWTSPQILHFVKLRHLSRKIILQKSLNAQNVFLPPVIPKPGHFKNFSRECKLQTWMMTKM